MTDFALAADEDSLVDALYRQWIDLAKRKGLQSAGGWLPETVRAGEWFNFESRPTGITMIKSLDENLMIGAELAAVAERFCEIDHV